MLTHLEELAEDAGGNIHPRRIMACENKAVQGSLLAVRHKHRHRSVRKYLLEALL